jgi:hypothetical protein
VRSFSVLAAAVAIGASAMTVACGQQQGTAGVTSASSSGVPSSAASPSASPSGTVPAACHGAAPVPAGRPLNVGNADNGKSFCLPKGGTVFVTLLGTPARMWSPVHASSAALAPRANGRLMLIRGATGAYFAAVRPGTVVLSSARPVCQSAASATPAPSGPVTVPCMAELAFRVTIVITGG